MLKSKIIQIASGSEELYSLDDLGNVYVWGGIASGWILINNYTN